MRPDLIGQAELRVYDPEGPRFRRHAFCEQRFREEQTVLLLLVDLRDHLHSSGIGVPDFEESRIESQNVWVMVGWAVHTSMGIGRLEVLIDAHQTRSESLPIGSVTLAASFFLTCQRRSRTLLGCEHAQAAKWERG